MESLQSRLRRQAEGLKRYDPEDPNLPEQPTLRQYLSTLQPDRPCCPHCSGSLLSDYSLLCIFCGASLTDSPPRPGLIFTSTASYRFLLSSLRLDGSEIIEPSIGEQAPNRSQNTPKDKILLSDLLNLEIPWLAKTEIPESSLSKNASAQSKSMTNTGVVDLDNLFTYAKDLVRELEEEQAVTNKEADIMKSNVIAGQGKPVFAPTFQNPVKAVVTSSEEKDKDFSCWEADFQSADSSGQPELLKYSAMLENQNNEPKDVSTPSVSTTSDWTKADCWNNSTNMTEKVETAINLNDCINAGTITPPENSGWFPDDDQWQTHSKVTTENNPTDGDADAFDVWDNFASSSKAQDMGSVGANEINPTNGDVYSSDVWDQLASSSKTQAKGSFGAIEIDPTNGDVDSPDVWDNLASSKAQDKGSFGASETFPTNDYDDSPDVWDDFPSFSDARDISKNSLTSNGIGLHTGDNQSSDVWVDITSSYNAEDPQKRSFGVGEINPTTVDDDSSDVWDDFTSFSNLHNLSRSSSIPIEIISTTGDIKSAQVLDNITSSSNVQDPFSSSYAVTEMKATTVDDDSSDVWDEFTSSSNAHGPSKSSFANLENEATTVDDDSSDVWDGFIGSSTAHDPLKNSIITTGSEPITGVDNSSDVWDGFTSYSNANDPVKSSVTVSDNKAVTEVDYSSDVWDFTSSSNAHDPFKGSVTSPITSTNNKTTNSHVDSSDFWDDFTSSPSVQNPSNSYNTHSDKEITAVGKQTIDTIFPSSTDSFKETDFGSFLQSDVPFGLVGYTNGPVEVMEKQSEVSSLNRFTLFLWIEIGEIYEERIIYRKGICILSGVPWVK